MMQNSKASQPKSALVIFTIPYRESSSKNKNGSSSCENLSEIKYLVLNKTVAWKRQIMAIKSHIKHVTATTLMASSKNFASDN